MRFFGTYQIGVNKINFKHAYTSTLYLVRLDAYSLAQSFANVVPL